MKSSPNWAFLQRQDITNPEGEVYLRRWRVIQTPWFGMYLHNIRKPDHGRHLHDHPFGFLSLVLCGGYEELTVNPIWEDFQFAERVRWWSLKSPGMRGRHRITRVLPNTWTLVFRGPYRHTWGFYTSEGFVQWQEYLAGSEVSS